MPRLWALLGRQVKKYTMGDSSSVTEETAEELFSSLCFTLGFALRAAGIPCKTLLTGNLDSLLKKGQGLLSTRVQAVKRLWEMVCRTSPRIQNDFYRDTLCGIGKSFKKYDLYFFADQYPETVDYPLINPVPESQKGILYAEEYLKRLQIENTLLNRFDEKKVIKLLESCVPDYRGMCINLCEQPMINALGRALIGQSIFPLEIGEKERLCLTGILTDGRQENHSRLLSEASRRLCSELHREDASTVSYLDHLCQDFLPRMESALSAGNLSNVFLSFLPENIISSWE